MPNVGIRNCTPMKKNLIMSRIAIFALGAGALCLATTSSALNAYPPLRTGANKDVSPAPAKGAAKAGSKLSAADKTFMTNAAKGGMMEVEWGKLAGQNGQNPDVKKFGRQKSAARSARRPRNLKRSGN